MMTGAFLLAGLMLTKAEEVDTLSPELQEDLMAYFHLKDSVDNALNFETGEIVIGDDLATIDVPEGFKYLNPEQSVNMY